MSLIGLAVLSPVLRAEQRPVCWLSVPPDHLLARNNDAVMTGKETRRMNGRFLCFAGGLMFSVTAVLVWTGPKISAGQQESNAPAERFVVSSQPVTTAVSPGQYAAPRQQRASSVRHIGGRFPFSSLRPKLFRPAGRQRPLSPHRFSSPVSPAVVAPHSGTTPGNIRQAQQVKSVSSHGAPQGESEVQRQLRLLYQKNGQQMPEMNLRNLPKSPTQIRAATRTSAQGRDLSRRKGGIPRKSSPLDFFKRWLPGHKKQPARRTTVSPSPRSGRYRRIPYGRYPSSSAVRTAQPGRLSSPQPVGRPAYSAQPIARPQPVRQPSSLPFGRGPVQPVTRPQVIRQPAFPQTREAQPGQITVAPQNRNTATARKGNTADDSGGKEEDLPVLIDERTTPAKPKTAQHPLSNNAVPQPKKTAAGDFSNPFTEGSEEEADRKDGSQGNPFTGLKLTEEPPASQKPVGNQLRPQTAGKKADETPTLKIQPKQPALPKQTTENTAPQRQPKQKAPAVPQNDKKPSVADAPKPAANKPAASQQAGNSPADKLRRIAARRGMTGFRGFCPVVLRDQRDLTDAQPAFHSVFEGKTYYFSSAAAKATFDRAPQKYAPAKGGQDVIRLSRGESVEGSLEHAVWFRDRLYFFSSAETLNQFVQQPAKYAVSQK